MYARRFRCKRQNAWQRFHGVQNCCKDVFYRSGCRQFYAFDYHTNRWGTQKGLPLKYLLPLRGLQKSDPSSVPSLCNPSLSYRRNLISSGHAQISGSRIGFVSPQEIGKPFQSSFSVRFSSSKGDGPSSSEEKHVPVKDGGDHDKTKEVADESLGKPEIKEYKPPISESKDHARLGEQEQKEWLEFQRIISENRKLETVLVSTKTKFRYDYMRRLVPWEANSVSWETFPYFVELHTKDILLECATAHLKCHKFASIYGKNLSSSSCRILLQSMPGTELYRERLVKSLAHHLQVPLLTLDSSVLAPHDFSEESASEVETDDETEHGETGEECSSGSDVDDENDGSHEEEWTSSEGKYDASDEEERQSALATTLKNLSNGLEDLEKRVSGEDCEDTKHSSKESDDSESSQKSENVYKKGDRIKYIGVHEGGAGKNRVALGKITTCLGPINAYTYINGRPLGTGQRGEVYEVNGNKVAILVDSEIPKWDASKEEKSSGQAERPSLYLVDIQDIEHDSDAETEECFIAVEALHETIMSLGPVIVYFPDFSQWLARAVPKSRRKELIKKVGEMLDQISGPVVMICGQNKAEAETKDRDKFTMVLPHIGRLTRLPIPLKHLTEGLKAGKASKIDNLSKLFSNVLSIHPPKDEEILKTFNKQLEEDRRIIISRSNLSELHKVLEEHKLFCHDLLHIHTDGVILTSQNAEKVIGWARNHYLSICGTSPAVSGERLCLPRESLEIALSRLKEEESYNKKPTQDLKKLARDEYESNFLSAVVPPNEVGVKFDDIGALEDVKNTLQELVTLPMRRPELFRDGNLLRPCKGVLLFGPPGTGKTLLAKALATEAGANFISITGSTLTSKWFGDAEKLTKALFSFASKLAPVIIFVDEVDSLLGARGGASEHEATRRMRNEFMAAWDGLRSKENQRILILAATNRPFDLDDAVIRRLPRRIYVDLPDANNRAKILRVILAQERLDSGFDFNDLAHATEGYSGSDLKNLCIAAAYRPIQELLEEEKKVGRQINPSTSLRMLTVDDFIEAKKKVGASVSYDAVSMNELRKWNEQYGEGGSRKRSPFGFVN
ncbi:uncharacterized protein LOC131076576 isoform X2 [Cryptomeria japonica]|uniref:uncharacterized protein LOC131076576 isoform X2 n=1 Tax=Cryptomeria japonica TaxID=3369 RepID=UPI0025AC8696|nr:uncharacterized protein LOC131076576 isoform X2 [Cryptomeria japonica]